MSAEIVQGGRGADGQPMAAIVLTLAPDWKTYWRVPGEGGGIPPEFDWSGSRNLKSVNLLWTAPEVWGDAGMTNIGYVGAMVLPVELTPMDLSLPVGLHATMTLGVCKDICIPVEIVLQSAVSGDVAAPPVIVAALERLPKTGAQVGASGLACVAEAIKDGLRISASLTLPAMAQGARETVVIEHLDAAIWASGAASQRKGDGLIAVADLVPPNAKPFDLTGDELRITILADGNAAEITGCPLN